MKDWHPVRLLGLLVILFLVASLVVEEWRTAALWTAGLWAFLMLMVEGGLAWREAMRRLGR